MTKPLGFATNAYGAQDILKAPAHIISVKISKPEYCETPFNCNSSHDAEQLIKDTETYLLEKREVLPASKTLGTLKPYPPVLTTYLNGIRRVSIRVYVIRRELPIGRSIKEARDNPLGYWLMSKRNPTFENRDLILSSHLLKNRFKTESRFNAAFATLERQGIVKRVMKDGFIRAKFRFLKAPRYTFDRDRSLIRAGQTRTLGDGNTKVLPQEHNDLFNPNIVIVENEGDGRAMGL